MKLTEEQWQFIEPILPKPDLREDKRGRPWRNPRDVLEGILWVLQTGARWKDLHPGLYPPYQTCHRRFQEWVKNEVMKRLLEKLVEHLRDEGTKIMAIADGGSLPLSVSIESASPHESQLVEEAIRSRYCKDLPVRLVGDKAYDSDPLDARLAKRYRIELIAPHKSNRKRERTQDGRPLRRDARRWTIERFFAWLHNFRRIKTRYEYNPLNYLGMVQLGCALILLRYL